MIFFSWGEIQFKLLGIIFDVDLKGTAELNFSKKLTRIKNIISFSENRKRRKLTLLGRITVVKSLLIPVLTHLIISLSNPTSEWIKQFNTILYNFLWDGKARIKRNVIIKGNTEGGLKMIDINSFIHTMKVK